MPGDQSNPARFIVAKEETRGPPLAVPTGRETAAGEEERVSQRVGVRI